MLSVRPSHKLLHGKLSKALALPAGEPKVVLLKRRSAKSALQSQRPPPKSSQAPTLSSEPLLPQGVPLGVAGYVGPQHISQSAQQKKQSSAEWASAESLKQVCCYMGALLLGNCVVGRC